jgi:benzil reductase ((S)-benzoin forming)
MHAHAQQWALVTGTTRGIGAAVAAQLLDRGWEVVGVARHAAPIEHARYRHITLDLAQPAALEPAIERELGPVLRDPKWRRVALVNNAAAGGALGPVEKIDPVEHARVAAINVVAATWLIGLVLRCTHRDAALRIVDVSSGAAVRAFPGLADYCGSKAALRIIGMAAAAELDSPLRNTPAPSDTAILSYEPGTVDTAMQEGARSRPLADYPWGQLFRDFHASGSLVPPSAPAREIVEFVEGDGHARFTERRLRQ